MHITKCGLVAISILSFYQPLHAQESVSVNFVASKNSIAAATQRLTGNALRWSPKPLYQLDKAYDRCLDSDAIASGMDGGSLESDRLNIGLDCANGTGPRYAHASALGGLLASESSVTPVQVLEDREIASRLKGDLLGYYGSSFETLAIYDITAEHFSVLPETVNYVNGSTYGLAVNLSAATAVSVEVAYDRSSYKHPISVQSGEVFPFALPDTPENLNLAEITFQADKYESLDMGRSILVSGAPGYWSGRSGNLPAMAKPLVDEKIDQGTLNLQEEISIFLTNLELVEATSTTKRVSMISDIAVSVAFLDSKKRIIGMHSPKPYTVNSDSDIALSFRESSTVSMDTWTTIAFEIPADAEDFAIWVGGSE